MVQQALVATGVLLLALPVIAQDVPPTVVNKEKVKYSPYPEQEFPNRVFFGDTHLHTSFSPDAGMSGTTIDPDGAYRFA